MIDKLITSDFAALAVEDRQAIPALDALDAAPVAKPAKAPRVAGLPWLLPIAPVVIVFVSATALSHANRQFGETPQLAVAFAITLMALIGVFRSGLAKGRSFANIAAAGLLSSIAAVSFVTEWHRHVTDCMFFDEYGGNVGPCQAGRFMTTTGFALISWGAVVLIAAVIARLIRREERSAWSIPAQITVVTVLLTWLGLDQYTDRSMDLIRFHFTPWAQGGAQMIAPHHTRVMFGSSQLSDLVLRPWREGQQNALEAGVALLALATTIGIACIRERERPSRWLKLLESPAVLPIAVTLAMVSLVLSTAQWELFQLHRGDFDDIPWFAAWASIGAVVAYASMLLRRRRREALS